METLQRKITTKALMSMGADGDAERTCPVHGKYLSIRMGDDWTQCGICHNPIADEVRRVTAERANQARAARANALVGRAAIPARFADRRFETFHPHCDGAARALRIAKDYAERFPLIAKSGESLILCGTVGAGKTHIAAAIAHAVICQDYTAVFTSVIGALRVIKDTYRRDSSVTEGQAISKFIEPELLILDEVGVQLNTDTEKVLLFEIINGRYERMKPTIVISNHDIEGLEEYLGERAVDRLREGEGAMISFKWPSYRKRIAA